MEKELASSVIYWGVYNRKDSVLDEIYLCGREVNQ